MPKVKQAVTALHQVALNGSLCLSLSFIGVHFEGGLKLSLMN
jgi:hypothetical protein